jgi:putative ABC transport system permease protein
MIKNYFKIAWRNLKKNRLYAFINITGLTVGIVSCLLIGIYIKHELSYDRFNENADRIVRVTMDYGHGEAPQKVAVTGTKVGPQFKRTFPGVADFVRLEKRSDVVTSGSRIFRENGILYADPSFLKIFSFKLMNGDRKTALNDPGKIIITQSTAKKYFDNNDPIGKTLKLSDKSYMVAGIAENAPTNSQIQFDFIVPFGNLSAAKRAEEWWSANYITYLLLKDRSDIKPLQNQVTRYMADVDKSELKMPAGQYLTYHLEPLTSVHLRSALAGIEPNGSVTYIYIMLIVALLILVIACVNYINLSIAQSAGRGAEIGIRKVMGAAKNQLFRQFIGESVFVTLIAVVVAFGLGLLLLPVFNQVSGKQFTSGILFDPVIVIGLVVLGAVIGFAAGAYPAMLLSNVRLAKILKSGFSFTSGQRVRSSLIIFQFVISIFLIVTTVVILQQLSYIRNKDIGYNKSNVVDLPVDYKIQRQVGALKKAIASIPGVESVASANNTPVDVKWGDGIQTADGKDISVNALPMDEDFIKTMQIKIVAGTDFNQTDVLQIDTTHQGKNFRYSFMLNESAARALGWTPEQAIGKEIKKGGTPGRIKAVVKDFNFKSFHDPISPLLIFLDHFQTQDVVARINGRNTASVISSMEKVWKERFPERPFEYKFVDEDYDALYRTEQRAAGVFTTFSILAIMLACLGLFAVTAYAVVQRTKEIGIRKVLGANVSSIILLISKDFLYLVILAAAIASPIAWYISNKWLQDFAYRINIHWWVFAGAGAACLIVAGITVSVQAFKAAMVNPVKSLKSE